MKSIDALKRRLGALQRVVDAMEGLDDADQSFVQNFFVGGPQNNARPHKNGKVTAQALERLEVRTKKAKPTKAKPTKAKPAQAKPAKSGKRRAPVRLPDTAAEAEAMLRGAEEAYEKKYKGKETPLGSPEAKARRSEYDRIFRLRRRILQLNKHGGKSKDSAFKAKRKGSAEEAAAFVLKALPSTESAYGKYRKGGRHVAVEFEGVKLQAIGTPGGKRWLVKAQGKVHKFETFGAAHIGFRTELIRHFVKKGHTTEGPSIMDPASGGGEKK